MTKNNQITITMTTLSRIMAKPLARAIIWGGNPAARIVNRSSYLIGRVATTIAPRRYHLGKTRMEAANLMTAGGFDVKWNEARGDWNTPRTDIVRDNLDGKLYMGSLGTKISKFQNPLPFPREIEEKISKIFSDLRINNRTRDEIRSILRTIYNEGYHSTIVNGVCLSLSELTNKSPKEFEANKNKLRKYADALVETGNEAIKKVGVKWTELVYSIFHTLINILPEKTVPDQKELKEYGDIAISMIHKAVKEGLDYEAVRKLEIIFYSVLIEISPEIFAREKKELENYWDILLTNHKDILINEEIRALVDGIDNERWNLCIPPGGIHILRKEILADKEKLGYVLDVGIKYPGKRWIEHIMNGGLQSFLHTLIFLLNTLPEKLVADNDKFKTVLGVVKKAIEKGWEPLKVEGLCFCLEIFFELAGERILKGDDFSRIFKPSTEEGFDDLLNNLCCVYYQRNRPDKSHKGYDSYAFRTSSIKEFIARTFFGEGQN